MWGQVGGGRNLGFDFDCAGPLGEVVFDGGSALPLLVKFLFTSQRLSVQVHPDDEWARRCGHAGGKDEAWFVLDCAPGAAIAMGTVRPFDAAELREGSLSGEIDSFLRWRPVAPEEGFYSPAGTIHTLGGGLSLVEVQQNRDLTYRLYDYGRARELQLDAALECASPLPFCGRQTPKDLGGGKSRVADGPAFSVERWKGQRSERLSGPSPHPYWVVSLRGKVRVGGGRAPPGTVWLVDSGGIVDCGVSGDLLVIAANEAAG